MSTFMSNIDKNWSGLQSILAKNEIYMGHLRLQDYLNCRNNYSHTHLS